MAIDLMQKKKEWIAHAYSCAEDKHFKHEWQPTSWLTTQGSRHVTAFTCMKCFHQVNVEDFHKYRKTTVY